MPISFAPGGAHYDVTPLENLFIENYMAEATGEFVKVYIYGLMFCYRADEQPPELSDIARDLHMNEETVRAAFAYWEKLQLVGVISARPLTVEYVNLKQKFISGTKAQELKNDKVFQELSRQIQDLFSGERVISTTEFKRVFDWYEVYRFEQAAIAPLVAYAIGRKGRRVSFNWIESMMMDLAEKGVTSAEDADRWIMQQEAVNSGAARVLARWSLRRAPTVDEMLLYRKWTEEWGFTEDAVIAACREITATDKPNFKYLDAIIESFHTEGLLSAADILRGIEERRRRKDICAGITKALGLRATVSNATELLRLFDHFTELGFTESGMELAAAMLSREGRHTLADLAALLNKWYEDGTVTDETLAVRGERDRQAAAAVNRWLEVWGQTRAPTAGEIAAYRRFTTEWGLPEDLVLFAAECSSLADRPLAMMGKLVEDWRAKGITDKQAAKAEHERSRQASGKPGDPTETEYASRDAMTKEQYDGLKTVTFDLKDL